MKKTIKIKGEIIEYNLEYKNVKNINLRIKSDCSVNVSANKKISESIINDFLKSKEDFIINALNKFKNRETNLHQYFTENDIRNVICDLCDKVYPYFKNKGIQYPQIKFRKMKSRWGSCNSAKGILTFNINLMYVPIECIEYVVKHEFTHFLQPNHSKKFYEELEKVCPDFKMLMKKLKLI